MELYTAKLTKPVLERSGKLFSQIDCDDRRLARVHYAKVEVDVGVGSLAAGMKVR